MLNIRTRPISRVISQAILVSTLLSSCADKKIDSQFIQNKENFKNSFSQEYTDYFTEPVKKDSCKKFSLYSKDSDLSTIGKAVGESMAVNFIIDESAKGHKFHFDFKDICVNDFLEYLTDSYNYGYDDRGYGYYIHGPRNETKTFYVNYHGVNRSGTSSISVNHANDSDDDDSSSSSKQVASINTKTDDKFWDYLENSLKIITKNEVIPKATQSSSRFAPKSTSKGSSAVSVDRQNGIIVVNATPRGIRNVKHLLKKIEEHSLKQVLIEAKILQVDLSDSFSSGINWNIFKSKDVSNKLVEFGTGKPIREAGALVAQGNLKGIGLGGIVKLLSSYSKTSVLSSPRISALNNQKAIIKNGTDQSFITSTSTTNNNLSGASSLTVTDIKTESYFSGISLDTTPKITSDNEIILHIHPTITKASADGSPVQNVQLVKVETTETDTVVKAKSGEVIILGGLIQDESSSDQYGLPIDRVSKPGLLNNLLSSREKKVVKKELVILLRPVIVSSFSVDYERYGK